MHPRMTIAVCFIVTALAILGFSLGQSATLVILAIAFCLVGLPHGALDHVEGKSLLQNRFPRFWLIVFLCSYLALAAFMALSWFVSPLVAILAFFTFSAWHFGREDYVIDLTQCQWYDIIGVFATGSLLMVIPAATQTDRLAELLTQLVPASLSSSAMDAVRICKASALILIPTGLIYAWQTRGRQESNAIVTLAFAVLFCVADPLISFLIYFCGWHSIRGLHRLSLQTQLSHLRLAWALAPLTLASLGMGALGWLWLQYGDRPSDSLIRTLFIGLSAIAVPHLLLHSLAELRLVAWPRKFAGGAL